jgi:hypothetical protein
MTVLHRLFSLSLALCCGPGFLSAQSLTVYPGDATNNGAVTSNDFLYLGLAYNYSGPPRPGSNNGLEFEPQPAQPWAYTFPNGANFAHADADGDGLVNYFYDAFPLYVHYGLQRPGIPIPEPILTGEPGVDPALMLDDSDVQDGVYNGQSFTLPLVLGTVNAPVEDLYGLAFSVFVDTQFVRASDLDFNFNESSWANPDNDRIYMTKVVAPDRLDVAWVRTDHNQRDGFGRIAQASIIIVIDVIDFQQSFQLRLDSVRMIDKFGNQLPVVGDTVTITVLPDAIAAGTDPSRTSFRLGPNPVQDRLRFDGAEEVERLALFNALGQPVLVARPLARSGEIALPPLPPGMYLVEVQTAHGRLLRKIQIRQ